MYGGVPNTWTLRSHCDNLAQAFLSRNVYKKKKKQTEQQETDSVTVLCSSSWSLAARLAYMQKCQNWNQEECQISWTLSRTETFSNWSGMLQHYIRRVCLQQYHLRPFLNFSRQLMTSVSWFLYTSVMVFCPINSPQCVDVGVCMWVSKWHPPLGQHSNPGQLFWPCGSSSVRCWVWSSGESTSEHNGSCSAPCLWVQAEQDHYTGLCSNHDNKRPQNIREAVCVCFSFLLMLLLFAFFLCSQLPDHPQADWDIALVSDHILHCIQNVNATTVWRVSQTCDCILLFLFLWEFMVSFSFMNKHCFFIKGCSYR